MAAFGTDIPADFSDGRERGNISGDRRSKETETATKRPWVNTHIPIGGWQLSGNVLFEVPISESWSELPRDSMLGLVERAGVWIFVGSSCNT